jgi:FKBP-type peptidyl-prolyl cis-trans isomerase (trigger factor)
MTDLKLDFTPTALKRIQVAIILKELAKTEKIQSGEKEVDTELDRLAEQYEDKETKEKIYEPQYRDYIAQQMTNRKVIDWLKEKIVK